MSLIDRIKSALGVGEQSVDSPRKDTRVKKAHNGSTDRSESENGGERTATTQTTGSSKESDIARETVQATNAGVTTTVTETQTSTETNEQSSTAGKGVEVSKSTEQAETEIETEEIEPEPLSERSSDEPSDSLRSSETDESETEKPETETAAKRTETAVAEQETGTTTETTTEPVDVIKGVGASYSEALAEAGIETVDELSGSDPGAVADETGLSEKRLERWIGRAEHRE